MRTTTHHGNEFCVSRRKKRKRKRKEATTASSPDVPECAPYIGNDNNYTNRPIVRALHIIAGTIIVLMPFFVDSNVALEME